MKKKDAGVVDDGGNGVRLQDRVAMAEFCWIVLGFFRCTAEGALVRVVAVFYVVVLLPMLCLEVFPRAPPPVSLLNAAMGVLLMYRLYLVLRFEYFEEKKKQEEEDQAAAAAAS
ncbi:Os07g0192100 [Oryza sativa Japonica Group]|nr:hypothetical protein OsI_25226 [Oryza sativa Indica Group]EAZ38992.1 hypothetical protein OsJ_23411 [Oryza sativa Japonica Group]BAT00438.1 Os07g0192100 [Oryza sativa Japonica Group]